jgi:hypothetical protein
MRTPVYRNLDRSFQILGLSPLEICVISLFLVASGELSDVLGIHRIWSLLFTGGVAFGLFWFRRSMGEMFAPRLLRFLQLPGQLRPRLLGSGVRREPS